MKIQERRTYDLKVNERDAVSNLLHCKVNGPKILEELPFAEQVVNIRRLETTGEGLGYVNTAVLIAK